MLPARPRATCCAATPPSPSASPCRAAVSRRVIAFGLLDRAVLRLLHRFQQRDAAAPLRSDRMPAVRAPTTPAERDPPRSGACRSAESPAEVRVSASSRRDASIGTEGGTVTSSGRIELIHRQTARDAEEGSAIRSYASPLEFPGNWPFAMIRSTLRPGKEAAWAQFCNVRPPR